MTEEQLVVKNKAIENITECVQLGSLLTAENDRSKKIQRRISIATGAMYLFGKIWLSKIISQHRKLGTKVNIIKSTVMGVVMCASGT